MKSLMRAYPLTVMYLGSASVIIAGLLNATHGIHLGGSAP